MTKRKVENIEALIGIKDATIIANVNGARVELLAFRIGDDDRMNILHMLLPFMRRRIEEQLRDYLTVGNVYDWEIMGLEK